MICQELNTTEMFCKQSKHNPLHYVVADYRQCDMSHGERDWEWLSHVWKLIDHTSLSLNKEINGCVLCSTCLLFWDCFRQVCNSSMKNRWKHESTVSVNGIEVCSQVTQCIQYYISPSKQSKYQIFLLIFLFVFFKFGAGRKEKLQKEEGNFINAFKMKEGSNVESS